VEDDHRERDTPEIDVERLLQKVRQELAATGVRSQQMPSVEAEPPVHRLAARMAELSAAISAAEQVSQTLAEPPALTRFRGPMRALAKLTVTSVIRLSRFLTDRQIAFNRAATHALRLISQTVTDPSQTDTDISKTVTDMERRISYLTSVVHLQERRIDDLLLHARGRGDTPPPTTSLTDAVVENSHALDALYATFQDRFRGSREDIKRRLRAHLPRVRAAGVGTDAMPIVDLGCGRGEWLELLRDEGLRARGVDLNRVSLAGCREMGLEIVERDAISFLQSLPDMNVGAVTGFHIIEHLPFDLLLQLLDEACRVLKPGGLAIFETPNPQNVLVGSCNFYLDPTHRNPLPAGLMQFMMQMRGFSEVEIVRLHPYPETVRVSGSDLADRFNEYFFGPQDYAVVGYKPQNFTRSISHTPISRTAMSS
jgi:SAM-dependent methyltransferase